MKPKSYPTPSADELRAKYGDYMTRLQISEAAGLNPSQQKYTYATVNKRMAGCKPAKTGYGRTELWTVEQVSAALAVYAEAHGANVEDRKLYQPNRPYHPAEDESVAEISRRCRTCLYSVEAGVGDGGKLYACFYIVFKGTKRPCKPGEACTEYKPRGENE